MHGSITLPSLHKNRYMSVHVSVCQRSNRGVMSHYLNSLYLCQDFFRLSLNFIIVIRKRLKPSQMAFKCCSSIHMVQHLQEEEEEAVGKEDMHRTPSCNTTTWRGTDALCSQGTRTPTPTPHCSDKALQYHQEGTASPATIPVLFNYTQLDVQTLNPCQHMASSLSLLSYRVSHTLTTIRTFQCVATTQPRPLNAA